MKKSLLALSVLLILGACSAEEKVAGTPAPTLTANAKAVIGGKELSLVGTSSSLMQALVNADGTQITGVYVADASELTEGLTEVTLSLVGSTDETASYQGKVGDNTYHLTLTDLVAATTEPVAAASGKGALTVNGSVKIVTANLTIANAPTAPVINETVKPLIADIKPVVTDGTKSTTVTVSGDALTVDLVHTDTAAANNLTVTALPLVSSTADSATYGKIVNNKIVTVTLSDMTALATGKLAVLNGKTTVLVVTAFVPAY
ncbi:MAG: hypothetical protein ACRC4N_07515 [Gammaproteobacteria bacterium]